MRLEAWDFKIFEKLMKLLAAIRKRASIKELDEKIIKKAYLNHFRTFSKRIIRDFITNALIKA